MIENVLFQAIYEAMAHTLIKLKLLKLILIGALGAGFVAILIAKEMREKKKTEDMDE